MDQVSWLSNKLTLVTVLHTEVGRAVEFLGSCPMWQWKQGTFSKGQDAMCRFSAYLSGLTKQPRGPLGQSITMKGQVSMCVSFSLCIPTQEQPTLVQRTWILPIKALTVTLTFNLSPSILDRAGRCKVSSQCSVWRSSPEARSYKHCACKAWTQADSSIPYWNETEPTKKLLFVLKKKAKNLNCNA